MKVAFHAINGVGLGHVVRTTCLAIEMRKLVPAIEILVVTNAGDTSLLEEAGLDYVQLPPRLSEPHADPNRSHEALPQIVEEAAIFAAFEAFGADLVVFDTHAPMAVVEKLPSIGARAVLVQRELRPEALRSFMMKNAALSFDRIVIPHEPGENDALVDLSLSATFVGSIVREMPHDVETRPLSEPLIVAMAGGGGQPVDAQRYVRAVADAHLLARARIPNLETILVVGPYGATPPNASGYPGLEIRRAPKDLARLLATATLVISQAGYNAIAEIRALEKPAILVPGYRKAEDQSARAKRLRKAGSARLAKPEARSIADRIEKLLLTPNVLTRMQAAHRANPLVRKNREAAEAVLRPIHRATSNKIEKVVLVAHDFAPKLGGMETVAASLANSLGCRNIDVQVYTTSRLGARGRRLYPPGPPPWRIDLFGDLLLTIAELLRDTPDVIHLCHAGLGAWIPALRAAFPAVTITANVHGNDLLAPWVRHDMEAGAYRQLQVAGLSQADAVFCVSSFSRDLALRHGVSRDRLLTVENGIDPSRFEASGETLRERIGLHATDEVLLTVSRLAPRKGHRTALRALAHLANERPRLKYVFTGASDTMRAELMQLAKELGIASRVFPLGFVPDADLPALYRSADIFALLADTDPGVDVEGFGVALLEAAAAGLPTIATRTGGMPEAVADGETGLLTIAGDPIDAANAIDRLLRDRALARALGEAGRRRVRERFTQNHATDRIVKAWMMMGNKPQPAVTNQPVQYAATEHAGGVEIVRIAQRHAAKARDGRMQRRETLKRAIGRDQIVRIRATGDGARLLPDVLEDCAALNHLPHVEVKLRKFLEPDFIAHALPNVSAIDLTHGVPHPASPTSLLTALDALPASAISKVKTVRLYLTPEARTNHALTISAVPEAHALRRFFASHQGVTVVPPPELMRYLSDVPAILPETGMIEPTNLCNLACPTCPTGTGKIKPLPQMTIERFDHILDALAPSKNGRMRNLALWNYGEPLLNRALPEMIDHAKKAGIGVVKVSSNVHFLDGDRGRALLASGLDVLILSVDGASQETYETFRKDGDFEKVAKAVAWLCAEKKRLGLKKPRIELQFIVMRHNEHELPEMRRLASEWGVDKLRVKTVGAEDEGTKSLVPVSRLLSRYEADATTPNVRHAFCTMAWDHTVVNVDGSITPCCYLRPDMGDNFVMGNIFESDFPSIWRGEKYRAFRESMLAGRADMPICNKCRGGTHDLVAATEEVAQQT